MKNPSVIIGTGIVILLLFLMVTSKLIFLDSYERLEDREVSRNVDRALSALGNELEQLNMAAGDYAGWDESYRFIQDGNADYIETNLDDEIFPKLRLNIILFVDTSGKVIFERWVDPVEGVKGPAPQSLRQLITKDSPLVEHKATESVRSGILLLPEGPLEIVSRPILTSQYRGPVRGALIMGRFLDSEEIGRLAETTHLSIRFSSVNDPAASTGVLSILRQLEENGKTVVHRSGLDAVSGYSLVRDLYGDPALLLQLNMPRDVYRQGMTTVSYYILTVAGVSIAAAMAGYFLYVRLVLSRRKQLASDARYHAVIRQASDGIMLIDADSKRLLEVNEALTLLLGYSETQLKEMTIYDISASARSDIESETRRILRNKTHIVGERRYRRVDNELVDVEVSANLVSGDSGEILCVVVRDITARKKTEERLRLLGRAVESSVNGIIVGDAVSPERPILFANPAVERITGYPAADIVGNSYRFLLGCDPDPLSLEKIRKIFREPNDRRMVLSGYHKSGKPIWVGLSLAKVKNGDETETHYVAVLDDLSEQRLIEQEMSFRAAHDLLTGLPNRSLLLDRLTQAMAGHERKKKKFCLMFIDLDHFKVINDTLGHSAGDVLLKAVAERLRRSIRVADTMARLGGDEFVVVLFDIPGPEAAIPVAEKILKSLAAPFPVEGREVFVSASIGLTLYPDDGNTTEILLKNADIAMYHAKARGRSNFQFFSQELNNRMSERLALETDLRRALDREELLLYYQPRLNMATGSIVGMEALVRWQHPEMGMLSPAKFIPVAEETGLIVPLGEWILRTACAQSAAWQKEGLPTLQLAVNLSARQFNQPDLVETVARIIRESGVDPSCLELELTESVIMQNAEESIKTLNAFKEMGVKLAIDDFGTGYSSLSYLKRFPLDTLKVDQSFVRDIAHDADNRTIVATIISMGRNLGLNVVAEGVETEEQRAFLHENRCEEAQGYLFSRPLPAESFAGLFESGTKGSLEIGI